VPFWPVLSLMRRHAASSLEIDAGPHSHPQARTPITLVYTSINAGYGPEEGRKESTVNCPTSALRFAKKNSAFKAKPTRANVTLLSSAIARACTSPLLAWLLGLLCATCVAGLHAPRESLWRYSECHGLESLRVGSLLARRYQAL